MTVIRNTKYKGDTYKAITDDTRVIDTILKGESVVPDSKICDESLSIDSVLLLRCKQNSTFIKQMQDTLQMTSKDTKINIAESCELNEMLFRKENCCSMRVVGITGTNGKTTTSAIIYSILLDLGFNVALLGTRGFFINDKTIKPKGLTTPSFLELYDDLCIAIENKCDFFIMEVSSHAIEQDRISGIKFDLKILTNITSDHLDYHKSIEAYREIKNSFFKGDGAKLINADESYAVCSDKKAFYYGIEKKRNMSVDAYYIEDNVSAHVSSNFDGLIEHSIINTNLYGKYNLYNALAALAAVKILTLKPFEVIANAIENFAGVAGRMEVVHQNPLVIIDFAHTYDGMYQVFESFKHKKIVVVFGAGGDRDKSKRPKMGECARRFAHRIYVTSDNPRTESAEDIAKDILSGIDSHKQVFVEIDRKNAIHMALDSIQNDEVLLILGKGDEDYQIIGAQKIYFDDREVVREYFSSRESAKS